MTNHIIRISIDANLDSTQINALIQVEFDTINVDGGIVTAYDEDFNGDEYVYNVTICYTTP